MGVHACVADCESICEGTLLDCLLLAARRMLSTVMLGLASEVRSDAQHRAGANFDEFEARCHRIAGKISHSLEPLATQWR